MNTWRSTNNESSAVGVDFGLTFTAKKKYAECELTPLPFCCLFGDTRRVKVGSRSFVWDWLKMNNHTIQFIILLALGAGYWGIVSVVSGAEEPWDAVSFWTLWYPGSLVLSAVAALSFTTRRWLSGALITFAQLPIIWINNGPGPLLAAGLVFLCVLALPAVAIAAMTGRLADRIRSI